MRWSSRFPAITECFLGRRAMVAVACYVAFVSVPSVALVVMGFRALQHQRATVRQLIASNLNLAGERLAADFERAAIRSTADLLRDPAILRINARIHKGMARAEAQSIGKEVETGLSNPSGPAEALFVMENGRILFPDAAGASSGKQQEIVRLLERYAGFFDVPEPGQFYPLAFPEAQAQLFYSRLSLSKTPELILFVLLRNSFMADQVFYHEGPARTGVRQPAELVPLGAATGGVQVRMPLLFPFWRIAMIEQGPRATWYEPWLFPSAIVSVAASMAIGLLLLIRDYLRQSRLSQLRAAFVGNVSHEFRTPLAAIRLNAEFLRYKQSPTDPEDRKRYNLIGWQTARLNHIVETILDVSKIDRGQRTYHFSSDDLVGTVKRTIDEHREYFESQGYHVQTSIASDLPGIWHDPQAVWEAIVNLLANAQKFSDPDHSIALRLEAEPTGVVFSVRDEGTGIPESEIPRIFDEFYRGTNATDKGGCGIGLYLVRAIMTAHQGTVEVQSEPGRGSTFRMRFPLWPKS